MGRMFYECSALVELNLSSFDVQDTVDFEEMFLDCRSDTVLKIRSNVYEKIRKKEISKIEIFENKSFDCSDSYNIQ